MGLALTALGGELLPERTPRDAARLLAVRHAGIAVVLAIARAGRRPPARRRHADAPSERGVALVLDAPLPPQDKLELAPALLEGVDADEPRAGLHARRRRRARHFTGRDRATYDELGERADDTLVAAVGEAFRSRSCIAGAAGAARGARCCRAGAPPRRWRSAGALALGTPVGLRRAAPRDRARAGRRSSTRAPPSARCRRPAASSGFLQDQALQAARQRRPAAAAPRARSSCSRLADEAEAKRFEREHGVDPRTAAGPAAGCSWAEPR